MVATYNVHKCKGQDHRTDPDSIAKVIAALNADIVATQEILDVRDGRPEFDQGHAESPPAWAAYHQCFGAFELVVREIPATSVAKKGGTFVICECATDCCSLRWTTCSEPCGTDYIVPIRPGLYLTEPEESCYPTTTESVSNRTYPQVIR